MRSTAEFPRKCRAIAALCAILPTLASAQANPLARTPEMALSDLSGRWNGANLEQRSSCTATQNNGVHGTYAEYIYDVDRLSGAITLTENTTSALHCTYFGPVARGVWSGELSCSDGKSASFESRGFVITPNEISVRLSMKLRGSETCDIDAILGGSRF